MISSHDQFAAMRREVPQVGLPRKYKVFYSGDPLAEIAERLTWREAEHDAKMPGHCKSPRNQSGPNSQSVRKDRNPSRRPSFYQCKERYFLIFGNQLLSDFECCNSSDAEARQLIWPAGL